MGNLSVRKLDDATMERLRIRAAEHGNSQAIDLDGKLFKVTQGTFADGKNNLPVYQQESLDPCSAPLC